MSGIRAARRSSVRSQAAAWLRALTRAGGHPVVRRLYDLVPIRWRDALRGALWRRANGAIAPATPSMPVPRPSANASAFRAPVPVDGEGVNLIGFAHGALGLSESFRNLARALRGEGYPVALLDAGILEAERNSDQPADLDLADAAPYAIDVVCINPDQYDRAMASTAVARRADAYRIGYWFWELERVPQAWLAAIDEVDEIWVASSFVRDAFAAVTDKPVTLVRMPVQPPPLPARTRSVGEPFAFLFSFDFHSYIERKNPLAVIEAFRRAFPMGDEPVSLVIKSNHGQAFRPQLYDLSAACAKDERISLRDGYLPRDEMLGLLSRADAYVSLHRSEGFGLGLAEAMAMGKAVVGTGYSGNLDFMTSDASRLVRYARVPASDEAYMHGEGACWAEPDGGDAARIMRELAADPVAAAEMGARAARHMQATHSATMAAGIAIQRLSAIHASLARLHGNTP